MAKTFFGSLFGAPAVMGASPSPRPGATDDFWYHRMYQTAAGINIDIAAAMTIPSFRRGLTVLAGSMASMPLQVFKRTDLGKEKAENNALYYTLHQQPNDYQSTFTWLVVMFMNLVVFNCAYARIVRGPRNAVGQLIPMRSDRVRVCLADDGSLIFEYTAPNGVRERLTLDEVFYVPGYGFGELNPRSLLEDGRDTLAIAIAMRQMLGQQFRSGVRLSGVIKHPEKISVEAAKRLADSWHAQYGGFANSGKTAVLEEGMEFQELSQKNTDAQIVELWQGNTEDIARLLGVPSILVGHSDKASTYASAEQFFQSFVTHSIGPWMACFEQAATIQLLANPERYFVEFNVAGLLRGDAKARGEFYQKGILSGWLAPNEARQLENLNKKKGHDDLLTPMNMTNDPAGASSDQPVDARAAA